MKKNYYIELTIIIVLTIVLATLVYKTTHINSQNNNRENIMNNSHEFGSHIRNGNNSSENISSKGNIEVTDKQELSGEYSSNSSDESAILVKNSGNLTITNSKISKSGDSSNTENSEFYGVNSGILSQKNSTLTISNSSITTNAKGANAVFSTGENSKIYISDSTINTTGTSSSRGLDATYGGYIEANNVNITTQGNSSATLATDRGEGTVTANNSVLETNGSGSPIIYSTGNISIDNTQGISNGSQLVVIEGKNSATISNSSLVASGKGNRNDVDNCGVMIYQSMSGDASEGTGTFNASNSNLSINNDSKYYETAPFFFSTNTDAIINLENNVISYGSNILLKACSTNEWGKSGSNGSDVTLNATNQKLSGNIEADNLSTVTINLSNNSSLTGTINTKNTAQNVSLKLDTSSQLVLTDDIYVTSLEDADSTYKNINFGNYKLYVNGIAIN